MVRLAKNVITSQYYEEHLLEILEYGIETFGYIQARKYFNTISHLVERLEIDYSYHPECRHLATKSHTNSDRTFVSSLGRIFQISSG